MVNVALVMYNYVHLALSSRYNGEQTLDWEWRYLDSNPGSPDNL